MEIGIGISSNFMGFVGFFSRIYSDEKMPMNGDYIVNYIIVINHIFHLAILYSNHYMFYHYGDYIVYH